LELEIMNKSAPQEGNWIKLSGPPDGGILPTSFLVLKTIDHGETLRVQDPKGVTFRVHSSRVAEVLDKQGKLDVKQSREARRTTMEKAEKVATKVAEKVATKVAEKVEKEVEKEEVKKEKKEKKVETFDLKKWTHEHGGNVLAKQGKFDHQDIKQMAYCAIDAPGGFYYCINAYSRNGVLTGANGESKFSLKGKTITIRSKSGKMIVRKGKKTAEETIKELEKRGYKKIDA
jgi:hypothetical protein